MQKKRIGQLSQKRLSDFRLIALDMDGTSLDSTGKLSSELINFINGLNIENLVIIFATGRMPMAIYNSLDKINISRIVVSHNGAIVSNLETGNVYYESNLPESILSFAIRMHIVYNIPLHFNLMDKVVTDKITSLSEDYANHLEININETNLSELQEKVISLLFLGGKHDLEKILEQFKKNYDNFSFVLIPDKSCWLLQILPPETSKGKGVIKFASSLNIPKEQIMSFGDSYNDIEMLENSGLAIAMENACNELKYIADYVAPSNDNNGVLEVLKNLL